MASFVYTPAKTAYLGAGLDMDTHDIRVLLVMTNTTADTDQDVENIADIGTLDEMDGASYARQTLTGEAINEDAANNRAEFDANDATFATLGAGTRQVAGAVLYRHVTNDADAVLIAYIDTGGFPFTASGTDVVLQWNAEGIVQLT